MFCKMIKKLLLIIVTLLPFLGTAQSTGSWKVHPIFNATPQNVVDAGDNVYYLISNNLFRYNKSTATNETLSKINVLNDVRITQIAYNLAKKYLVVVYDSSNLDFIKADGTVVNVSAIYDAVMTTSKTINSVSFTSNGAYFATNFGYVVIDDDDFTVKESHVYNSAVTSAARVGELELVSVDGHLYYAKATEKHNALSDFKSVELVSGVITPINDTRFFIAGASQLNTYELSASGDDYTFTSVELVSAIPTTLQATPAGFVASFYAAGYYVTFNAQGNKVAQVTSKALASTQESDGSMWIFSTSGIKHGSAAYIKPNSLNIEIPWYMFYMPNQNKLYVVTRGASQIILTQGPATAVNTLDCATGKWTDESPTPTISKGGTFTPMPDPNDPDAYYLGTWLQGIYRIKNKQILVNYYWDNSPLRKILNYFCNTFIAFDKSGNMWVAENSNTTDPIVVLPKDKVGQTTVVGDWITPSIPGITTNVTNQRTRFVITPESDIKVQVNGDYAQPFYIWDDGGDPTSSSIKAKTFVTFPDQDAKTIDWTYIFDMKVDNTDRVWVGYNNGVFSFDPKDAFNDGFCVDHIKVPRNDGTNNFDYLLEGVQVNAIGIDKQNRKWLGTNTEGVVVVSPDGSQIIKRLNADNSILSSNQVYNIYCNPVSNSVYISCPGSFLEYIDETPAVETYDNVFVTPNAVDRAFTGYVLISNLVTGSYVNITDSSGNLVHATTATGSVAKWDACDEDGDRVPAGIYYICASPSDSDTRDVIAKVYVTR